MGLFSDIYNTVAKFFRPQEEQGDASKSVATNRLKLVLMQDRTNLTPKILEQMRGELIDLLSRYVELDKELLELNFEQEGDQVALMLSIPVIRAKDEDEIELINNEEDEVSEEALEDENSEEIDEEVSVSDIISAFKEKDLEAYEAIVNELKENRLKNVTVPEEMSSSKTSENEEELETANEE